MKENGDIIVAEDIDWETASSNPITFNVEVTDSGGNVDTANVQITINDINDNYPVFGATSYR